MKKPNIIVIHGPQGVGKSTAALRIRGVLVEDVVDADQLRRLTSSSATVVITCNALPDDSKALLKERGASFFHFSKRGVDASLFAFARSNGFTVRETA